MKILNLILGLLVVCCMTACSNVDPTSNATPNNEDKDKPENVAVQRNAPSPGQFSQVPNSGAPRAKKLNMSLSDRSAADEDYYASCVEEIDDEGNYVFTCDYDGMICVETYDPDGNFLNWYCDDGSSFVCGYLAEIIECLYVGPEGEMCTAIYDYNFELVESDCFEQEEPVEECVEQSDGTIYCEYDDGYTFCSYLLDANYEMIYQECSGEWGMYHCFTAIYDNEYYDNSYEELEVREDGNYMACYFEYVGFDACQEVYNVDYGYGLLYSDCDWDQNGEPDCVLTDYGLACFTSDEFSSCEYLYSHDGIFEYYYCEYEEGYSACEREEEIIYCVEYWGTSYCESSWDLFWNNLEYVCEDEMVCVDDSDCEPGFICWDGMCVYDGEVCYFDEDCEDGNPYTLDMCVDGECVHMSSECDPECPDGYFCDEGMCVPVEMPCMDNLDCDAGYYCLDGICMEMPIPCWTDLDCYDYDNTTRDFCIEGECYHELYACETDSECPEGLVCENWVCVEEMPIPCWTDLDCSEGYVCLDGECFEDMPIPCTDDNDCPSNKVCGDGLCVDDTPPFPCESDLDCGEGYLCLDGECFEDMPAVPCMDDLDCSDGEVCIDGECVEHYTPIFCEDDLDCAENETCMMGECVDMFIPCDDDFDCGPGSFCLNGLCTDMDPPPIE